MMDKLSTPKHVVPLSKDGRLAKASVDDVLEWLRIELESGTVASVAIACVHDDHAVSYHRGALVNGALIAALESMKLDMVKVWSEDD